MDTRIEQFKLNLYKKQEMEQLYIIQKLIELTYSIIFKYKIKAKLRI